MTSITGLDDDEAAEVATAFGVAAEQVRRDHLISLVLAALTPVAGDLTFFGGTALARTHLPRGRLSEDIDLITKARRRHLAEEISLAIETALRPTYGRVTWSQPLASVHEVVPAVLRTDDGLRLRIQLLTADGYPPWPTEVRDIVQRYRDSPPARLRVPTRESFVAWKTVTWADRAAPRDLYDLWALAEIGAITAGSAQLFAEHGPIGAPPEDWMFRTSPRLDDWTSQLAGQTRLTVGPETALTVVRSAWHTAVLQM